MVSKIKTEKYCLYFYTVYNGNKYIGGVISEDDPNWLNGLHYKIKHEGFISKDDTLCFFAKPLKPNKILNEFRRNKQNEYYNSILRGFISYK